MAHPSLAKDREVRLPPYALAGIPEVWPFTEEGAMGVYRELRGRRYPLRLTLEPGEEIAPLSPGTPYRYPARLSSSATASRTRS